MRLILWVLICWHHLSCAATPLFTNEDWSSLLAKSKQNQTRVLVYTWSPHMPLSRRGLEELYSFEGIDPKSLVILLDPNADTEFAADVAKENHWPPESLRKVASIDLIKQGVRIHYPSYLIINKGQVRPIVMGYKSVERVRYLLNGQVP
jgi:hypothetical protein